MVKRLTGAVGAESDAGERAERELVDFESGHDVERTLAVYSRGRHRCTWGNYGESSE